LFLIKTFLKPFFEKKVLSKQKNKKKAQLLLSPSSSGTAAAVATATPLKSTTKKTCPTPLYFLLFSPFFSPAFVLLFIL